MRSYRILLSVLIVLSLIIEASQGQALAAVAGNNDDETLYGYVSNTGTETSSSPAQVCGNNVLESPEECDDGNIDNTDACTNACLNAACGDTFVQAGETCDDGNIVSNDGCSATCILECGNGTVEGAEQCDDGNVIDGDGCSAACFTEGRPPDALNPDTDTDGVNDPADNCPTVSNPDQADTDKDGTGDACDSTNNLDADLDANNDGINDSSNNNSVDNSSNNSDSVNNNENLSGGSSNDQPCGGTCSCAATHPNCPGMPWNHNEDPNLPMGQCISNCIDEVNASCSSPSQ